MIVVRNAFVLFASTVLLTGCVSKSRYDAAVAKSDEAVAQHRLTQAELDKKRASLAASNAKVTALGAQIDASNARLETQRGEIARLEERIAELSKSSQADREANDATLATLRKRLDELKASQAAADARAALFRDVAMRLKKQVDAGDLTIVVRDGRMVLQLPDDVLFDTGRTELKSDGRAALEAVAGVLSTMPKRHFQVAGHTDNVPIRTNRFPSNWELSSGRALRVVHFLIDKGVAAEGLSAAGYGETDPIADNTTVEGRKRNRRTEISVQPNIDELVKVP